MVELTYLSLKKTTFFVRIFDISHCVFTQISIGRARWMRNQIPHPTSSPDRNLSKDTGTYVENTNTKSIFFLSSCKINQYYFIILTIILLFKLLLYYFPQEAHFRLKFPLMGKGHFLFCSRNYVTCTTPTQKYTVKKR